MSSLICVNIVFFLLEILGYIHVVRKYRRPTASFVHRLQFRAGVRLYGGATGQRQMSTWPVTCRSLRSPEVERCPATGSRETIPGAGRQRRLSLSGGFRACRPATWSQLRTANCITDNRPRPVPHFRCCHLANLIAWSQSHWVISLFGLIFRQDQRLCRWFAAQKCYVHRTCFRENRKDTKFGCPLMWNYDICVFDSSTYYGYYWQNHDILQ